MRFLKWFPVVLICVGTFLCYRAPMLSSSERWNPVHGPILGPGLTVASPFFLDSGGNYSFELQIPGAPRQTVAMPELPPVKASLDLTITGPNHFSTTSRIAALRQYAEYPFGHLYIEQWLQQSPGTRETAPTTPSPGVRHFEITAGGGAQGADVTVDDTNHRVSIYVYWS